MINSDLYSLTYPGRIVEYFPEKQTATVKICAERIYSDTDNTDSLEERELLYDVPVHTPSGGGWSFTVPIKPNDTCLLMFSQVGYDHWLFLDKDKAGLIAERPSPLLKRQFHEEDGFALVGFNTLPRAIAGYSADSSEWRNSDRSQRITLDVDGSIHIKAGSTTINMTSDGAIAIDTETTVDITAPTTTCNGDLHVTGTITCPTIVAADSLQIDGKEIKNHTHNETGSVTGGNN